MDPTAYFEAWSYPKSSLVGVQPGQRLKKTQAELQSMVREFKPPGNSLGSDIKTLLSIQNKDAKQKWGCAAAKLVEKQGGWGRHILIIFRRGMTPKEKMIKELEEEVEKQRRRIEGLEEEVKEQKGKIERQRRRIDQQEEVIGQQGRKIDQQEEEIKRQGRGIGQQKEEIEQQGRKIEQQKKEIEQQKKEIEQQGRKIERQEKDIKEDIEYIERQEKTIEELEKEIKELKERIPIPRPCEPRGRDPTARFRNRRRQSVGADSAYYSQSEREETPNPKPRPGRNRGG
jgi:predicted  nucleic acid-binding Zn-ribbon protein